MLGLSGFTEIPKIFIGTCGSTDVHFSLEFITGAPFGGAHTHTCPNDPLVNCICVSDTNELLDFGDSPSPLFIHEYGHVLRGFPDELLSRNWRCAGPNSKHTYDSPTHSFADSGGHDSEWGKIVIKLGIEPTLHVRPSYKIQQNALAAALIR